MSRRVANPALAKLCRSRDVNVNEIAQYAGVSRVAIWQYVTGRQQHPRLEQRMAVLFGLSRAKLRSALFPEKDR